eukprot:4932352-Amphidinium_carterae.2
MFETAAYEPPILFVSKKKRRSRKTSPKLRSLCRDSPNLISYCWPSAALVNNLALEYNKSSLLAGCSSQ